MSDRLGAEWRDYRVKILPVDAPPIQARECRLAFYAGASALLGILLGGVGDDPDEPATREELAMMGEIQAELEQFVRDILAGKV